MNLDLFSSLPLTLSVSWLLLPLGFYFAVFVIYSFFNMYHLFRFGVYNFGLYIISTIYILGTVILVSTAIWVVLDIDWSASLSLESFFEDYSQTILPL